MWKCILREQNELLDTFNIKVINFDLYKVIRQSEVYKRGTTLNKSTKILTYAGDLNIIVRSRKDMIDIFLAIETAAYELHSSGRQTKWWNSNDRRSKHRQP